MLSASPNSLFKLCPDLILEHALVTFLHRVFLHWFITLGRSFLRLLVEHRDEGVLLRLGHLARGEHEVKVVHDGVLELEVTPELVLLRFIEVKDGASAQNAIHCFSYQFCFQHSVKYSEFTFDK